MVTIVVGWTVLMGVLFVALLLINVIIQLKGWIFDDPVSNDSLDQGVLGILKYIPKKFYDGCVPWFVTIIWLSLVSYLGGVFLIMVLSFPISMILFFVIIFVAGGLHALRALIRFKKSIDKVKSMVTKSDRDEVL